VKYVSSPGMEDHPGATPIPAETPPDPPTDRAGRTVPERIAAVLHTVRTLLGFGRHLTETAPQRAAAPTFPTIAVCFGTGRLSAILAHLNRGILRAMALERVLLERAARGRDIEFFEPRRRTAAPPSAAPTADPSAGPPPEPSGPSANPPAEPAAAAQPAAAPPARKAAARPTRPPGWDDPELFMPTLEDLMAQVRRRPIGRTITEICLDCGVVPGICDGAFWNQLFDVIRLFGGSVAAVVQERMRREAAFEKEQDRRPISTWQWWDLTREKTRQVLGFFVGEPPVDPFAPAPSVGASPLAIATGPP
jgi:hypothetical protein